MSRGAPRYLIMTGLSAWWCQAQAWWSSGRLSHKPVEIWDIPKAVCFTNRLNKWRTLMGMRGNSNKPTLGNICCCLTRSYPALFNPLHRQIYDGYVKETLLHTVVTLQLCAWLHKNLNVSGETDIEKSFFLAHSQLETTLLDETILYHTIRCNGCHIW